MIGKIFITREGYDPQLGKHVKDPYLGDTPTLGACRPDIRKRVQLGDHLFFISGKVPGAEQFVMGAFSVAEKMTAQEAFNMFPDLRLREREDGQLTGNIIVDASGAQHPLDDHSRFDNRIKNYVVGCDPIIISKEAEIQRARVETLRVLQQILGRKAETPFRLVGRFGIELDEVQVQLLREWLLSLKAA